jgi:hypothetical protein
LADLTREEREAEAARLDERWDRLAAGELTAEEEAELRALAETSPEAREALEAFRPLGPDFEARVVDAVAAELAAQAPEPERREPRSQPRPSRRHIGRRGGWVAAAAAAAAALVLLLRPAELPPLPTYNVKLIGGDQSSRGTQTRPFDGLPIVTQGSLIYLVASPAGQVTGPVEAQVFVAQGSEIVPLELKSRLEQRNGAVRLRGTLGREIQLPSGEQTIWLIVGRPGKIPPASEVAGELRAGRIRQKNWEAMSVRLRVPPPP